tara:strand:+ start:89 stop:400 length:312 start_codon:yes stop_codon:yes gene_type:complete
VNSVLKYSKKKGQGHSLEWTIHIPMSNPEEINPEDLRPMGQEEQLVHFTQALWNLISRFQGGEFELSDPCIIYAFEDIKARMLEEMDLGTEMLDNDSETEFEN